MKVGLDPVPTRFRAMPSWAPVLPLFFVRFLCYMSAYFPLEFVSVHANNSAPGIAVNALSINVIMVINIIKVIIRAKLDMNLMNLIPNTLLHIIH